MRCIPPAARWPAAASCRCHPPAAGLCCRRARAALTVSPNLCLPAPHPAPPLQADWWLQIALGVSMAAFCSTFIFPVTAGESRAAGVACSAVLGEGQRAMLARLLGARQGCCSRLATAAAACLCCVARGLATPVPSVPLLPAPCSRPQGGCQDGGRFSQAGQAHPRPGAPAWLCTGSCAHSSHAAALALRRHGRAGTAGRAQAHCSPPSPGWLPRLVRLH